MALFKFAAVMGCLFLAFGVLGFADGFVAPPQAEDQIRQFSSNRMVQT